MNVILYIVVGRDYSQINPKGPTYIYIYNVRVCVHMVSWSPRPQLQDAQSQALWLCRKPSILQPEAPPKNSSSTVQGLGFRETVEFFLVFCSFLSKCATRQEQDWKGLGTFPTREWPVYDHSSLPRSRSKIIPTIARLLRNSD